MSIPLLPIEWTSFLFLCEQCMINTNKIAAIFAFPQWIDLNNRFVICIYSKWIGDAERKLKIEKVETIFTVSLPIVSGSLYVITDHINTHVNAEFIFNVKRSRCKPRSILLRPNISFPNSILVATALPHSYFWLFIWFLTDFVKWFPKYLRYTEGCNILIIFR